LKFVPQGQQGHSFVFGRFEQLRRPRIERVVKLTSQNSSQKRATGAIALFIRDLLLPFVIPLGIRRGRKLCAYRADLTPLQMPN